ncbi:MAG: single-stranded-DNA-specific exonuclease RecJ [Gammaproteobacteria bacterium]|nr:single-stranded-DNA-specific exonuclease RecJ [Gammaproteobacteria bacterium]
MAHHLPSDLHPVLARIYAARSVTTSGHLEHALEHLLPYHGLMGILPAAALLADAVIRQRRILILGDFDADGATSCALAVRALRQLGVEHVGYLVPNRFEFGYGLTPEIVAVAAQRKPDVLITVDNGISSVEGVRAAKNAGMQVVVTDHHLPGEQLPDADAIVNPNQRGDTFASKNLAGVGVIFYVMLALRAQLRERNWFARPPGMAEVRETQEPFSRQSNLPEPNLARLLDLVALGTVADVVPLDFNNRILVQQGLARLRKAQCCAGIRALLQVSNRRCERVVAADLAFAVAPRLNAAGRLEDMSLGIECLLIDNEDHATTLAQRLDELNHDRREIETQMKDQALAALKSLQLQPDNPELPVGLCLFDPHWHQGVIGLLAARVKEKFHRPVIAFAPSQNDEIKGSARSVSGLHIRDALDAVAARHPGLVQKFGGHAMAAGLTLRRADYEAFSLAFDTEVRRHLQLADLCGVIQSDGELQPAEITLDLAQLLRYAAPWGQSFPEPMFDGIFDLVQHRVVGERHLKMVLRAPGENRLIDAIAFNTSATQWPAATRQVSAAYRVDVNEYQGRQTVQLVVEHVEPACRSEV